MFVLSSLSVSEGMLAELNEKFPNVTFSLFDNMDKAKTELHKAEILITYGEDLTDELMMKPLNEVFGNLSTKFKHVYRWWRRFNQ